MPRARATHQPGRNPHLLHAIKQLLAHPRPLLDPRLLVPAGEELRSLDDADGVVRQVRDSLAQEVAPGAEVGVEDDEHLRGGDGKSVSKVPRLPQRGTVRPPDICFSTSGT